jgi:hypothetical protein
MKKKIFAAFVLLSGAFAINAQTVDDVKLEKELSYDQHTLADTYPYNNGTREFQWDKIKEKLAQTDALRAENCSNVWGVLQNKSNVNGRPSNVKNYTTNEYRQAVDRFGVEAYQAIPLYLKDDLKTPDRYALDGSLVKIIKHQGDSSLVATTAFDGEYIVPNKYIHTIATEPTFEKVIIIDRNNQNISTFEKVGDTWKVRSMNPCTTGAHHPPYQKPTPLGLFVLQQKVAKMLYYVDGTTEIGGYAPWANRFSSGAYMHGVPVNLPQTEIIEFSATLGTIPRSHMCVRNASSHSKFIYDNFPVDDTLVFVIE